MKNIKQMILRIFLICLCLSVLTLVGCEYLPIDFGGSDVTEEPAHEHTFVEHAGKDATCTEGGWLAYKTCSGCDDYTDYEAIEPLGHDYTADFLPGTDSHSKICQRCSDTISDVHVWQSGDVLVEPTCITEGTRSLVCTVCGALSSETTPALGHDHSGDCTPHGDNHDFSCTRCSDTVSEPHAFVVDSYVSEPTCVAEGVVNYVCHACGATKGETVQPLGHDFSDEFTANGAEHRRVCTRCTASTDEAPHAYVEGEIIKAPTCTETGIQLYACSVCGDTKEEILDEIAHTYSSTYVPNGEVHSRFCTDCGASMDAPHNMIAGAITKATCTEDGSQLYTCAGCALTNTVVLPMTGHTYSENYVPNGDVHSRHCLNCDATDDRDHDWGSGDIVKTATCSETGIRLYECSVCSDTKTETVPTNDEHIEGGWETIQMPTATVRGSERLRCALCNKVINTREISCDADSMSVLYMVGEYQNATKEKNEVPMQFTLVRPDGTSYEGYAKMKVQGSSSVAYPKKNYTLKLYKDSEFESKNKINVGWGKENKYVIKANWVDFSNARNVVSCRLWGDIVASRPYSETQARLAGLKTNGGAIDGFPVAVYMNGEFYGLYTWNVPKDEWMFDMGDSETEAILGADDWNHTDFNTLIGSFHEDASGDIVSKDGGWELVYCGSDDYSWVAESFDALIKFCQENDGDAFRNGIHDYLDVDAAIDYIIYMYAVCMRDNASKNMLWITYDGKVWTPSVYDQDGTFGQSWDGVNAASASYCLPTVKNGKVNPNIPFGPNAHPVNFILWDRILNCFTEEVLLRYQYLRQTTLSVSNMIAELQAFEDSVPESIYAADRDKWAADREAWWAGKKGSGVWYEKYHFDYMYQWIESRMANYDNVMRNIYDNVYLPKTDNPAL